MLTDTRVMQLSTVHQVESSGTRMEQCTSDSWDLLPIHCKQGCNIIMYLDTVYAASSQVATVAGHRVNARLLRAVCLASL
eukprot:scaffold579830_cov17-Prasinocladus_malaysianus.AAC.1